MSRSTQNAAYGRSQWAFFSTKAWYVFVAESFLKVFAKAFFKRRCFSALTLS